MTPAAWKPQGTFDHYWFAHLTAHLWERYLLPRFKARTESLDLAPLNYIEVGVCEGMSMLWALEHFGKPGGLFVGVDPFWNARRWHEGEGDGHARRARDNVSQWYDGTRPVEFTNGLFMWNANSQHKGKPVCQIQRHSSQEYLKHEDRQFDIAYCDGSHNADDAMFDIIHLFRLLKNDGVLVVDDLDRKNIAGRPQVHEAVAAFRMTFEGWFDILYWHQRQIAFVKRSKRRRRGYPPVLEQGPCIEPTGPLEPTES